MSNADDIKHFMNLLEGERLEENAALKVIATEVLQFLLKNPTFRHAILDLLAANKINGSDALVKGLERLFPDSQAVSRLQGATNGIKVEILKKVDQAIKVWAGDTSPEVWEPSV